MKALTILKKYPSVEERATTVIVSLKRDIIKTVLDPVQNKIDRLEDEIADLQNFSLQTNLNHGQAATSKAECLQRFQQIIEKKYQLDIAKKEFELKKAAFDEYFTEEETKAEA